jgi:hypothetical protein
MRHRLVLVPALLVVAFAAGCRFSKATDVQINPPPDPGQGDDGGGRDHGGLDIIIAPPVDATLFESEASVNCIEANPQTMNLPPDVLIVLDRSGSMDQKIDGTNCNNACKTAGMSKWIQMTGALNAFIPTVETSVNWGLKLFASDGNMDSCNVSTTVEVAPQTMNAVAIAAAIAPPVNPGSATPTTKAENAAVSYLSGLDDGNPKFILLATDGIPTCGTSACAAGSGAAMNSCDDVAAVAAVQAAFDMGIKTFVIGIGTASGGGDATLTMMAKAGGFERVGQTPSYYPVASANDLKDAFAMITQTVGSCFFSVKPVPKSMSDIVDVKGDDNVIPQDATDGWTFVGTGANPGVQLNGKSCEDYKTGTIKTVLVDLPCVVP